jgi:hypothetical protein
VTGTGKQHVADNYASKIFKNLEANNNSYAQNLNFWAEKTGFVVDDW